MQQLLAAVNIELEKAGLPVILETLVASDSIHRNGVETLIMRILCRTVTMALKGSGKDRAGL